MIARVVVLGRQSEPPATADRRTAFWEPSRLAPPDVSRQVTYRLILREIPEALPPKQKVQISIALALSMPVFITPPKAARALNCSVGAVKVRAHRAIKQLREVYLELSREAAV